MPPDHKLPRGVLQAFAAALSRERGRPLGINELVAARMALDSVLPAIQRDAVRQAARHVLALDAAERAKRNEPGCRNVGPWNYADSSLRRLARGEPLPDIPPKEAPDG